MINPAIVRILKIVALIGFALPWLTVSCQGTKLFEARGYELVIGQELKPNPAFEESMRDATKGLGDAMGGDAGAAPAQSSPSASEENGFKPDLATQLMAGGAAAVILLGLLIGFAVRDRVFAVVSAVTGLAGAGLAYATLAVLEAAFQSELTRNANEAGPEGAAFQNMAAAAFQFSFEPGAWVTIVASGLAGLVGLFVLLTPAQPAAPSPPAA